MTQIPLLSIKDLSYSIGKQHILKKVSFDQPQGSILGLIGANGAGKSTIMKLILGLNRLSSGQIKINGHSVDMNHRQPLREVGSMIETPALYKNLTGWDHLKLLDNGNTTKEGLVKIAKETDIYSFMHQKAKNYSLGMKQRLGIAMTLVNHPKLLILDEPMNALDPQSTYRLRKLLLHLAHQGVSILISSHILGELARIANYYVVINHGRVVARAKAEDILNAQNDFIEVKTSNNDQVAELLQQQHVDFKTDDDYLVLPDQKRTLNVMILLLVDHRIQLEKIHESNHNLEDSVLKLLSKGEK